MHELKKCEKQEDIRRCRYHVVHHGENGVETHSFYTKRDLTKHLKPVRPESIVAMYRGSKLHAMISNDYQII